MNDGAVSSEQANGVPPWYRQFWPWFLIALPASIIVASFFMLYLAVNNSDTLVSDNYYRDGLAINKVLTQDLRAAELAMAARVEFADQKGLRIELSGREPLPSSLTLRLSHPTNASGDRDFLLPASGPGLYSASIETLAPHRYYLRLLPGVVRGDEEAKAVAWRLNGEVDLAKSARVALMPINGPSGSHQGSAGQ